MVSLLGLLKKKLMTTLCFTSFVLNLGIITHLQYKKNRSNKHQRRTKGSNNWIGTSNMHPSIMQKEHKKNLAIIFFKQIYLKIYEINLRTYQTHCFTMHYNMLYKPQNIVNNIMKVLQECIKYVGAPHVKNTIVGKIHVKIKRR